MVTTTPISSTPLNVQVVPNTPMFVTAPTGQQVMNPAWIQWYRTVQNRIGGADGNLVSSVEVNDISTVPIFNITNSEDQTSGTSVVTVDFKLQPQLPNLVLAGPTTGGAQQPDFRSLINTDLPVVNIAHGGTGIATSPTNGQLLIGNTLTNQYVQNTLTGVAGQVGIVNSAGSINIGLANTTVTAGSYTLTNITVDSFGRITAASSGSSGATVAGTAGQITITASGSVSIISIDTTYVGQASITTLGTITTGVWNGTKIDVSHGGTNLTTATTNGQLLIGNGAGTYTLNTITASTGINIANGSGTIAISNTGVLSLTGTANQVAVSGSSGAITLTLPANVVIPSPSTGTSLTVTQITGQTGLLVNQTGTGSGITILSANAVDSVLQIAQASAVTWKIYNTASTSDLRFNNSSSDRVILTVGGNLTVNTPTSGQALTLVGASAGTPALTINTSSTTGSTTAGFAATNKPGTNNQTAPSIWIPMILDGTTYYVPGFAA